MKIGGVLWIVFVYGEIKRVLTQHTRVVSVVSSFIKSLSNQISCELIMLVLVCQVEYSVFIKHDNISCVPEQHATLLLI